MRNWHRLNRTMIGLKLKQNKLTSLWETSLNRTMIGLKLRISAYHSLFLNAFESNYDRIETIHILAKEPWWESLNRTMIGLKLVCPYYFPSPSTSLNRTMIGLKLIQDQSSSCLCLSLNRTMIGLKQSTKISWWEYSLMVWIELW